MRWKRREADGAFRLRASVEIEADAEEVFARWSRIEGLPRCMHAVRRVKRIDAERSLWDVDVAGRQVVWEARVVECVPGKLLRWESLWGARHRGEVEVARIGPGRTRLDVRIAFRPRRGLERLGARLGLADFAVASDLARFRAFAEAAAALPVAAGP